MISCLFYYLGLLGEKNSRMVDSSMIIDLATIPYHLTQTTDGARTARSEYLIPKLNEYDSVEVVFDSWAVCACSWIKEFFSDLSAEDRKKIKVSSKLKSIQIIATEYSQGYK